MHGFIKTGMVPNMEIGAICDHDQAKAEIVQSEFPDVKFYSDYETMLDSGRRRRHRHLRPSLPTPGDGHCRTAARGLRALDLAEPDAQFFPFVLVQPRDLLERHPRHRTAHAALLADVLDMLAGSSLPARASRWSRAMP